MSQIACTRDIKSCAPSPVCGGGIGTYVEESYMSNAEGRVRGKQKRRGEEKALTRNPSALIHESEPPRQMGIIARSNGPYFSPIFIITFTFYPIQYVSMYSGYWSERGKE